ncbi:MAG: NAD(P)H-hydrate epimerase, partial [Gammaproteobacteria bacterium]
MPYRLPQQLYTAEHVRQLDRIAIDELKIPGYDLMQRAASFSNGCLKQHWPEARKILVVCGGGNNAGDGYVLARYAIEEGKQVQVGWLQDPEKLQGDASTAYRDLVESGCKPEPFDEYFLNDADIVVDALLGTGLDRDVEGAMAAAINAINDSMLPVLSIDIPSGLHADTGRVMGTAVKADVSPSFIGLKQGMFTNNGEEYAGKILFNDLEVPEEAYRRLGQHDVTRLLLQDQLYLLEPRQRNAHKGEFGHVLVIGGDSGYVGA